MAGNGTSSYFEQVYDRYSAVMYGCILKIVKEREWADAVLRKAFIELKASPFMDTAAALPEAVWFIKYAMQKAFQFLKTQNPASYSKAINEISAGAFSR